MTAAARRLQSLAFLLAQLRERLGVDVGFVLWDGSTVPTDLKPNALAVVVADEGAVAALVRRPNIKTLANLWVTSRISIRNGTLFDLVDRRPKVRIKELRKALDKMLLLKTGLQFLFVPRGGPWPLDQIKRDRPVTREPVEDKSNIHYHYGASNAFYELWLDREMVYTCAYFTEWHDDIDRAQRDKLDMICRKLRLKPGDTLLDLGCGWGGLVCHAAEHYGAHAYGVTLAVQQARYAQETIVRRGLGDRAKVECKDYAGVEGTFDKVSAICILEHVGIDHFEVFYRTVQRCLKPGGFFLNQSIARPAKESDRVFRKKNREYAALTQYIFPGAELDYIGRTTANLERYGFEVHDVEGWREHYQRTCRIWHDRLIKNYDAAVREVGSVTTRLWLLYLAGCSIAFERNTALVFQVLASKRARGPSGLPPTRADLYRQARALSAK
jgi:cyclopropane-fatty-acyl-phospholipid synthase